MGGCQLYHGSSNISYFNDTSSIDTLSNTVNAKSKYLFLTPNKRTAFNYSQINKGMDVKRLGVKKVFVDPN